MKLKFRKFGNHVFNINHISLITSISEYEEWGETVELVEYMKIKLKCGTTLKSEEAYKRFKTANDYLEYIINADPNTDVGY